jgi:nitrogen regulatory protein PII
MTPRKLLTIICEADLERSLADDLSALGARGFTITDARGQGAHGARDGLWPSAANIRIEVLCDDHLASAIAEALQARYYEPYAMVIFIADVLVLRPGKF